MRFEVLPPTPASAPFVERLWTLHGTAATADGFEQAVLPDGRIEIILHAGDPFECVDSRGVALRQARLLYAGQLTRELRLRPTGRVAIAALTLRPFGGAAVLKIAQADLAGDPQPLQHVAPELAAALSTLAARRLALDALARRIESAVVAASRPDRIDPRVRRAVDAIERSQGQAAVARLAAAGRTSARTLERLFRAQVGMSPKRLARIVRFQRALRALDPAATGGGAVTAAACGYADQAHFIRDFRALAGCSPSAHLLERAEMIGFFLRRRRR